MMVQLFALLAAASAPDAAVACPQDSSAPALICRALAAQGQGQPDAAAERFEQAASALPADDPRRDRALAAAGNMWIVANQPGKAAFALDRALAGSSLLADQRGEALLDRARAAEAQGDLKTARAKVDEAAEILSEDPFVWYFSAALALREENGAEARESINRALALAPGDPLVLFEAGHVAHFEGDVTGARAYWTRAAEADPEGEAGKAAKEALALLDAPKSDAAVRPEPAEGEQPS